jgi:hypothetical protein
MLRKPITLAKKGDVLKLIILIDKEKSFDKIYYKIMI